MDGDSHSIYMIVAIILLAVVSAFFSGAEAALQSINKGRIKNIAQGGGRRASIAQLISERHEAALTAMLIWGAAANLSLASVGAVYFSEIMKSYGTPVATSALISTAVLVLVTVIFGEIFAKTAAREHADSFVVATAGLIYAFAVIITPVTFVLLKWKALVSYMFKRGASEAPAITEEELITIVEEAEQDGGIDSDEGELIRSAIEFTDSEATDILTPVSGVAAISGDADVMEIAETFIESGYSRLPVYGDDIDDIIGILHEKDFFMLYHKHGKQVSAQDIVSVLMKPAFVSGHIKISDLLQVLKSSKCHMAIVLDEFGSSLGIVTMEDIIEELIGDVWDEHDEIVEEFKENDDGSVTVMCSADIEDLFERCDFEELSDDEDEKMPQTVNGWLLMKFGNIPEAGEKVEHEGYEFEVTKTAKTKIEEVKMIKIIPPSEETDAAE